MLGSRRYLREVQGPAVIGPTDSGTAAKPMRSPEEERSEMAGNSSSVCSHQQEKFFQVKQLKCCTNMQVILTGEKHSRGSVYAHGTESSLDAETRQQGTKEEEECHVSCSSSPLWRINITFLPKELIQTSTMCRVS